MIFVGMTRRLWTLALTTCVLTACAPPNVGQNSLQVSATGLRPGDAGFSVMPSNVPNTAAINAFAIDVLASVQSASIAQSREYCGYIFVDNSGRLQATAPAAGTFRVCELPEPRFGQGIVASYHTHGSYSSLYASEVPSLADLQSDFNYGIDGYVATPGGRVWHNSANQTSTRQLCSLGCLASDRQFDPQGEPDGRPASTLRDIVQRHRTL
jgi:hypothetical protein